MKEGVISMDEAQIGKMLNTAAARLGMTPEELKTAVSGGDVNSIMSRLDKGSAEKVKKAMSNKDITDKILSAINKKGK